MKTIYYSPFGGEVLSVQDGASGDVDYEEYLRAQGVKFKKATVADGKVIGGATGTYFDEKAKAQVAER